MKSVLCLLLFCSALFSSCKKPEQDDPPDQGNLNDQFKATVTNYTTAPIVIDAFGNYTLFYRQTDATTGEKRIAVLGSNDNYSINIT